MAGNPYDHSRLQSNKIAETLSRIRARFADRAIIVLTDDPELDFGDLPCFDYGRGEGFDFRSKPDRDSTIFVYAFNNDDVGAPIARRLLAERLKYIPLYQAYPAARFHHLDAAARIALRNEFDRQEHEGFAKWNAPDFENICQALAATRDLAGAYVEVGCFQGSSGCVALAYMKEAGIHRDAWFTDVFEGFTYDDARASADATWAGSHKTDGLDVVTERLERFSGDGLSVHVERNNIIEDDLPVGMDRIAVANLDVDLYEAVRAGLEKLAPRIVHGGILIVEDPGHTPSLIGARVALQEFLETPAAKPFVSLYMASGQTFLTRIG